MRFISTWPIDRTLSGATSPGHSGPGSDGNEVVLRIPQSSGITVTSSSECLVSYIQDTRWWWGESYPSAEVQSVYSTAPAGWTKINRQLWADYDR